MQIYGDDDQDEYNVEFITRVCNAHDALLEACKAVIRCAIPCHASIDSREYQWCVGYLHEALPQICTAIAKAEGIL